MTTTMTARPASLHVAWPSVIWMGAIHVGALLVFLPAYFSWSGVAICLLLHWLTGGIGICMTYHRLLTHRSFTLWPKWLEYPLTVLGTMASEGGEIGWVADHRRHHAYSDDENDTHTPAQGFFWAHMVWWMLVDDSSKHTAEYYKKWTPDLYKDPVHRWIDRYHIIFPIALMGLLYYLGGMSWLVWGGFFRTIFVLHTTWLVNSASHIWGYRSHPTRDKSTNLWWVALLTYGEGWHNNHHAFQTSARHGLDWWEVDPTYLTIKLLSLVGLAGNIKLPRISTTTSTVLAGSPASVESQEELVDDPTQFVPGGV